MRADQVVGKHAYRFDPESAAAERENIDVADALRHAADGILQTQILALVQEATLRQKPVAAEQARSKVGIVGEIIGAMDIVEWTRWIPYILRS